MFLPVTADQLTTNRGLTNQRPAFQKFISRIEQCSILEINFGNKFPKFISFMSHGDFWRNLFLEINFRNKFPKVSLV